MIPQISFQVPVHSSSSVKPQTPPREIPKEEPSFQAARPAISNSRPRVRAPYFEQTRPRPIHSTGEIRVASWLGIGIIVIGAASLYFYLNHRGDRPHSVNGIQPLEPLPVQL